MAARTFGRGGGAVACRLRRRAGTRAPTAADGGKPCGGPPEPCAMTGSPLELVCPAGTPGALRAAVDAGADTVYLGFRDETNARNFPGLNFSRQEFAEGAAYAHSRGSKIYVAINTFPDAGRADLWHRAVDDAAAEGADAVVVADAGLLAYARQHHPNLRLHLSVQASASNTEALGFYQSEYGIKRAVLPRVLTIPEIARITAETTVEVEVFVFGGLCPMAEGRCVLSAYVTGVSPNRQGARAPATPGETGLLCGGRPC